MRKKRIYHTDTSLLSEYNSFNLHPTRDIKFGIKIGSDWLQIGQIWNFLRSVSVHFGSASQNVLKLILKSPRFVFIWGQSDSTWMLNLTVLHERMAQSMWHDILLGFLSTWCRFIMNKLRESRVKFATDLYYAGYIIFLNDSRSWSIVLGDICNFEFDTISIFSLKYFSRLQN